MRTPTNQIFSDIDFLVDELGGISAEYFCEEFIFETGDPDDIPRLHNDDYLKINWRLN